MATISDLKDLPEQVTTTINTQALLAWLCFGTTEPPLPASPPLRLLRRHGRPKTPRLHPVPVVTSTPAREGTSSPDKE
ncbi:MAG: hypothetical protein HOP18_05330 [Deltaproteobacteria bacterium]|nr:hypothetical protein [Deltaproteobacteria bacterium]